MRSCSCIGLLLVTATLTAASPAWAGLVAPPWHNASPADFTSPQTQQAWRFDSLTVPQQPDPADNANGMPTLTPTGNPQHVAQNPYGQFGAGGFLVGGSRYLDFYIPNFNQMIRKEIWITIRFALPPAGASVPVLEIMGLNGSPGTNESGPQTPAPVHGQAGMMQVSYLYSMPTCWSFNMQLLVSQSQPGATAFIDEVCVFTRCIPTPGAGAAMALGMVSAVRRRR